MAAEKLKYCRRRWTDEVKMRDQKLSPDAKTNKKNKK